MVDSIYDYKNGCSNSQKSWREGGDAGKVCSAYNQNESYWETIHRASMNFLFLSSETPAAQPLCKTRREHVCVCVHAQIDI